MDETTFIGLPKDPRLNTNYIDIPLTPSVIQVNRIVTTNPSGETLNRILFGRYNDPIFGNTVATGFANFAPPVSYTAPTSSASYDSLVLQLNFDYYYYGDNSATNQKLQIFEVLDTLHNGKLYSNNSTVGISSVPLAESIFTVDGQAFDDAQIINVDSDTSNNRIFTLKIKIPGSLGPSLFEDMRSADSILYSFFRFSGKYKGFAFSVPDGGGDKIMGVNPVYRDPSPKVTDTKLSLYYNESGVSVRADFLLYASVSYTTGILNSVTSFSTIKTDRTGTPLSGIVPFKDFKPNDGKYYIQGGTSLLTKFNLKPYYDFADTATHIALSEVRLMVTNKLTKSPANFLSIRLLDSLNQFVSAFSDTLISDATSVITNPFYSRMPTAVTLGSSVNDTYVSVSGDVSSTFAIPTDTDEIDPILITEFCQQLYKFRHDPRRPKALGLMVYGDSGRKALNGAVLDPQVSLRIYYTTPVVKIR